MLGVEIVIALGVAILLGQMTATRVRLAPPIVLMVFGVAMNLIFLAIYLILFTRTLDGHFTVGEMVMLIQMVTMARQPVTMMSWIVDSAQRAIAGSRDYFKVMDEPVEPTGDAQTGTGGRPAALYRFRREVIEERPAPGLRFGRG